MFYQRLTCLLNFLGLYNTFDVWYFQSTFSIVNSHGILFDFVWDIPQKVWKIVFACFNICYGTLNIILMNFNCDDP